MIPLPPERIKEELVKNSDAVLVKASQKYDINGFAYVFEVGQPEPCFYFALNTSPNGEAAASTGEWDYPAGGFEGSSVSDGLRDAYSELDAYMMEDEDSKDRIREIQAIFCSAMKVIRGRWLEKLGTCIFTINECNDDDQVIQEIYEDINEVRV